MNLRETTVRRGGFLLAALALAAAACTDGPAADTSSPTGTTAASVSPTASPSPSPAPSATPSPSGTVAPPTSGPTGTIPLPTPTSGPAGDGTEPQEPAPTSTGGPAPGSSTPARSLEIVAPNDGATVDNPVSLEVEVSGFELVELGGEFREDEGHLWAFVDQEPPPGQVVLPESTSVHKSAETTIDLGELAPGEHTVTVVASHGYPVPFDPRVDDVVTFTVPG